MIQTTSDKTFSVIHSAVNKFVDFVAPTFGPASNKVIINKNQYSMVIDDGVQIARDFELEDKAEQSIVRLVRETAIRTNDRVGDGTTGSLLMLQAIINEYAKRSKKNGREAELELQRGLEDLKKALKKDAVQIKTKSDLKKVALVAFDNEEIAEMIAKLYMKIGKNGIVTIDKSPTMDTYVEMTDGVKIDTGYISPYMITNPERMEAVYEKPYILLTDYTLTEASDVIPIMEKMAQNGLSELVIISENVEAKALATIVVNKMQGKFSTVAIALPKGDHRNIRLEDVALLTGGKVFSESHGDTLENAEISDLGRADKFICKREDSVIVEPKGSKKKIKEAVQALIKASVAEKNEKEKSFIESRISMFLNTLAVVKVGAVTENEQKTLKYKVEDAINAVKVAYRGGVVCGSGLALARIKTSSKLLNSALQYPAQQLRNNAGLDDIELKKDEAQNVVTGEIGHFMKVGVVDPVEALIAGVESAVSIASILVTSSGIIYEVPDKE